MTKINTENWKEFRVGDLFEVCNGNYIPPNIITDREDGIPYVTASNINNGVGRYISPDGIKTQQGPAITWGKQCPCFCYQPEEIFATGQGMYYIKTPGLSRNVNLFLCSVLQQTIGDEFNYSNCLIGSIASNLTINLPVTPSGTPDWDYMDTYIENLKIKAENKIKKAKIVVAEPKKVINTDNWGDFKVGELFENYHGQRQKVSDRIDGDIPLVTAGKENLGVAAYISNPLCQYNNAITVDMFGNCFYHNGVCAGDDNIYFFINDAISTFSKLFIVSVITSELKDKYSYEKQFRQPDANALTIKLPITPDGQPNWEYMENYIKNLKERIN